MAAKPRPFRPAAAGRPRRHATRVEVIPRREPVRVTDRAPGGLAGRSRSESPPRRTSSRDAAPSSDRSTRNRRAGMSFASRPSGPRTVSAIPSSSGAGAGRGCCCRVWRRRRLRCLSCCPGTVPTSRRCCSEAGPRAVSRLRRLTRARARTPRTAARRGRVAVSQDPFRRPPRPRRPAVPTEALESPGSAPAGVRPAADDSAVAERFRLARGEKSADAPERPAAATEDPLQAEPRAAFEQRLAASRRAGRGRLGWC